MLYILYVCLSYKFSFRLNLLNQTLEQWDLKNKTLLRQLHYLPVSLYFCCCCCLELSNGVRARNPSSWIPQLCDIKQSSGLQSFLINRNKDNDVTWFYAQNCVHIKIRMLRVITPCISECDCICRHGP